MKSSHSSAELYQASSEEKFKALVHQDLTLTPDLQGATYEQFHKKYTSLLLLANHCRVGEAIHEGLETYDGFTPLIIAADRNLEVLALKLLNRDGMPEHIDQAGQRGITALHCAARRGNVALGRRLLELGATCLKVNTYQHNALHFAAMSGNADMVALILESSVKSIVLCSTDKEIYPLHLACQAGDFRSIQLIAEQMDEGDFELATAQHSPLIMATESGCVEGVKYLLERIPNARESLRNDIKFGLNLLMLAAKSGNVALFECLKTAGARSETLRPSFDDSFFKQALLSKKPEMIRYILDHEFCPDLNKEFGGNIMPLHFAVDCRNLEIVEMLVQQGADVNKRCEHLGGATPMELALANDSRDIALFLYEKGAACSKMALEHLQQDPITPTNVVKMIKPDEERQIDPDNKELSDREKLVLLGMRGCSVM